MPLPNILSTPSWLQKLQWVIDPVKYMEQANQQYPDIFTGNIIGFGNTVVFVNHPQAIQEIFTNDRKKFAAVAEVNKIFLPILGESTILMLEGESHQRQRRLLTPPFYGERMRTYGELICNLTDKTFSQFLLQKTFSARNAMQDISLQVILQAIFGLYEGECCEKLKQLLPALLDVFNSPFTSSLLFFSFLQKDLGVWSPWGRFVHLKQQVDELLYTEIAERRKQFNPNATDILSLLISARDEEDKSMTDRELRDMLITLMLAGYESTATAMAWALYWIHQKPEILKKVLQELDTQADFQDPMSIFRLPYLTSICNESLRIHPVLMFTFPRVVQEPVELLGHWLEPGTILVGCIYLTHHRADLYPQSQQFKPERFLEQQFSPYQFFPFGCGARSCLGQTFAMFEMKLVLARILSQYQLELVDRHPEKMKRRGFTLAPARGVKMAIKGRRVQQKSQVNVVVTTS